MTQAQQVVTQLFPEKEFNTTELTIIAQCLGHPVVKKYFLDLASRNLKAIVFGQRKPGESAESYLERQAVVAGGLAVIEMLLAVELPISPTA